MALWESWKRGPYRARITSELAVPAVTASPRFRRVLGVSRHLLLRQRPRDRHERALAIRFWVLGCGNFSLLLAPRSLLLRQGHRQPRMPDDQPRFVPPA